jgi:fluoride exporter
VAAETGNAGEVRRAWDVRRAAAIAVGGAAGASVRWGVVTTFGTNGFPWPVLAVNAIGSVLLGVVLAEEWTHPSARLVLHDAVAIGFCGGLTTFSTFAVEVVDLWRDGDIGTAVVYGFASVVAAITGVVAGAAALRRTRAIVLPLEESP